MSVSNLYLSIAEGPSLGLLALVNFQRAQLVSFERASTPEPLFVGIFSSPPPQSLFDAAAAGVRYGSRLCENSRSALTSTNFNRFLPSVAKSECLDICSLLRMQLSRATQIVFTQPGSVCGCCGRPRGAWLWSDWRLLGAARGGMLIPAPHYEVRAPLR